MRAVDVADLIHLWRSAFTSFRTPRIRHGNATFGRTSGARIA
jgi:hypothetical protein